LPLYSLLAMLVIWAGFVTNFLAGMPEVVTILATAALGRARHGTLLKRQTERLMVKGGNDRGVKGFSARFDGPWQPMFQQPFLAMQCLEILMDKRSPRGRAGEWRVYSLSGKRLCRISVNSDD
jgi:hypothetical protein